MDPLSLAAKVLAVVGAAQSTLQALKRLKDARFAPNQISQLLDEVADFERVIVTVARMLSDIDQQPVDPGFNKHLASLIQRAMDQVTQINRLAEDGWIRDLEAMNEKSAAAAWKHWLRSITLTLSPVFLAAVKGDVALMQNLFRTGLASPFDVSKYGTTLLSDAIGYSATLITDDHVDMCRFLLQQAADPYQEDEYLSSPIHYAWNHFLLAPKKPQVQALKAMLDQYLDPEEDLKPFRLTILHQIVLGLIRIDLSAQLEYSTADIDVGCSKGKTPLCWAVFTRNELMVKKLLDFHARVDLRDRWGNTVFHRVIQEDLGYEILETLISAAYSQQDCHSTFRSVGLDSKTLISAAYSQQDCHSTFRSVGLDSKNGANTSNAQIGVNPSVVAILDCVDDNGHTALSLCSLHDHYSYAQILLTHGATVSSFAFLVAVQYHAHHMVELLLNAGATTNWKDQDGMNVLHIAGNCCNIEMIRLLKDAKLCCLDVEERDKAGMTPLEAFDIGRAQYHSAEEEGVRRRCREAFLELLASVRGVGDGHVCTGRGRRILSIEEEKAGILDDDVGKSSSLLDDSDEDEFFNAGADFGTVT